MGGLTIEEETIFMFSSNCPSCFVLRDREILDCHTSCVTKINDIFCMCTVIIPEVEPA